MQSGNIYIFMFIWQRSVEYFNLMASWKILANIFLTAVTYLQYLLNMTGWVLQGQFSHMDNTVNDIFAARNVYLASAGFLLLIFGIS